MMAYDDFDAQEAALVQQAARIKALRARADAGYEAPGEAPGTGFSLSTGQRIPGRVQRANILGALAPLVAGYRADRMEPDMNSAKQRLTDAMHAQMLKDIGEAPQGTPAQAAVAAQAATPETLGAYGVNIPGTPAVEARAAVPAMPPSRQAVLEHAAKLGRNPLTRTLSQQYLADQLIKEPEREEARAERVQTRADALAAAKQKQADELEFKRWQVEQNAQVRRDIAASRASGSGGEKASNYQIVDTPNGVMRVNKLDPTDVQPVTIGGENLSTGKGAPKNMPAGEQGKYTANKATMDSIDAILGDTKNRDATGFFSGGLIKIAPVLGTKLVNAWGTMGEQERRAAINRLTGIEVHRLYGASQTLGEIARAGGFMPDPQDSPDAVEAKLRQMKASIDRENIAIDQMAVSQGYKRPGGGGGPKQPPAGGGGGGGGGAGGAPSAAPRAGDVVDGYRFKGGNVNDQKNWEPVQ